MVIHIHLRRCQLDSSVLQAQQFRNVGELQQRLVQKLSATEATPGSMHSVQVGIRGPKSLVPLREMQRDMTHTATTQEYISLTNFACQ